MDRAHRIGQTCPVTVYRLLGKYVFICIVHTIELTNIYSFLYGVLADSTIEARVVHLQDKKKTIASHVCTHV